MADAANNSPMGPLMRLGIGIPIGLISILACLLSLGILGWVVKNRTGDPRLDPRSLAAYERMLPVYLPPGYDEVWAKGLAAATERAPRPPEAARLEPTFRRRTPGRA